MPTNADVVRIARGYIDTPYHHLGRLPGIGLDCAGVLICAGRELGLVAPDFDVPAYKPEPDGHSLIDWCEQFMGPRVAQADMRPGHGIVIRVAEDPQHLGVIGDYVHGGLSIIHATSIKSSACVIETRLMFARNLRFVAAFAFPGVTA